MSERCSFCDRVAADVTFDYLGPDPNDITTDPLLLDAIAHSDLRADERARAISRLHELDAERDRLRKALEQIARARPTKGVPLRDTLEGVVYIATTALGPREEGVGVSVPGNRDTRESGSSHVAPSSVDAGPEASEEESR